MSQPISPEQAEKLSAYTDLFTALTDAQIAEQLSLEVAVVAAYRAQLQGQQSPSETPPVPAVVKTDNDDPARVATTVSDVIDRIRQFSSKEQGETREAKKPTRTPPAESAAASPPASPPAAEPVPSHVRVVRTARVRRDGGRSWLLKRGDLYRSEQAAWLWAHHRELVEPYSPKE